MSDDLTRQRDQARDIAARLEAELARLVAGIRERHKPKTWSGGTWCMYCFNARWPCPDIEAVEVEP